LEKIKPSLVKKSTRHLGHITLKSPPTLVEVRAIFAMNQEGTKGKELMIATQ
jgi:hypothetical protein